MMVRFSAAIGVAAIIGAFGSGAASAQGAPNLTEAAMTGIWSTKPQCAAPLFFRAGGRMPSPKGVGRWQVSGAQLTIETADRPVRMTATKVAANEIHFAGGTRIERCDEAAVKNQARVKLDSALNSERWVVDPDDGDEDNPEVVRTASTSGCITTLRTGKGTRKLDWSRLSLIDHDAGSILTDDDAAFTFGSTVTTLAVPDDSEDEDEHYGRADMLTLIVERAQLFHQLCR